jgi:hypothetical protein
MLPDSSKLPVIVEEPVRINVSIAENVELPDTTKEPLIIAPFDDVTDDRWASLPLTITLFQVANYYSILLLSGSRISISINMNLPQFWSNYKPNCDLSKL